jgi:hypothetical protein
VTLDKGRHKEIRKDVISFLETLIDKNDILSSHTIKGDIHFYRSIEKNVKLAQPDIICLKNGKIVLIIEVELSSQPKHLFGVASSINSSDYGSFNRKKFYFDIPVLFIIVYSKGFDKPRSIKPFQLQIIREEVDKNLRLNGLSRIRIKMDDDYYSDLEDEINRVFRGELVV